MSFAGGKSFFVTFEILCSNTVYGIQLHLFTLLIQGERVQQHLHLKGEISRFPLVIYSSEPTV